MAQRTKLAQEQIFLHSHSFAKCGCTLMSDIFANCFNVKEREGGRRRRKIKTDGEKKDMGKERGRQE